jgi:hypothetical protein
VTTFVEDTLENSVATRIRRVREAFADSRAKAGVLDTHDELVAGFDETEFDETVEE